MTRVQAFGGLSIFLLPFVVSPTAKVMQASGPVRPPDVVYVPTPPHVVDFMLKMAKVTRKDAVYDLGCGDGRIVIEAARTYGARGVGIDIDPERIAEAESNAQQAGVTDRVTFRLEDLFESEIREASVVTLYLLPELNLRLRPRLWKDLDVGTRIVSHGYDMDDWTAEEILLVSEHPLYLWTITDEIKRRLDAQ